MYVKPYQLKVPLQKWHRLPEDQYWPFTMASGNHSLYYRSPQQCLKFHASRFGRYPVTLGHTILGPPTHTTPISVLFNDHKYIIPNLRILHHAPQDQVPTLLTQFLQFHSDWEHLLLRHIHYKHESLFFHLLQKQAPMIKVTDRGAHQTKSRGAFGWVIALFDGILLVTNRGEGYGLAMDSFCMESHGPLLACMFVQAIYNIHALIPAFILHFCNNNALVWRLTAHLNASHPVKTDIPHWDITCAIVHILKTLPCGSVHCHVEGNQDCNPEATLDVTARLNVIADKLASQALEETEAQPVVLFCPLLHIQLNIQGQTYTTKIPQAIRHHYALPSLMTYWTHKLGLSGSKADLINWHLIKHLMALHQKLQHFLTKFVTKWLPTNRYHSSFDPLHSNQCHQCQHVKTQQHLLICPAV